MIRGARRRDPGGTTPRDPLAPKDLHWAQTLAARATPEAGGGPSLPTVSVRWRSRTALRRPGPRAPDGFLSARPTPRGGCLLLTLTGAGPPAQGPCALGDGTFVAARPPTSVSRR